jgi:hypothetical protein
MNDKNELSAEEKLKLDLQTGQQSLLINPELIGEISPTLPENFPKDLIPKEICEKQLNKLLSCLLFWSLDNVKCEGHQMQFYQCKKWRDTLLFKRIKEWEENSYSSMPDYEQSIYLDNLKLKKLDLINKYDEVLIIPQNRGKRQRISYDIDQLDWRIKYLNEIKKSSYYV